MVRTMSAREARAKFSELIGSVYYTGEPVVVERNGKPFAVLVNPDEYERWREYISIDLAAVERIQEHHVIEQQQHQQ